MHVYVKRKTIDYFVNIQFRSYFKQLKHVYMIIIYDAMVSFRVI